MGVDLSRFVEVAITRATRTVSRRSFGTILIVAYHMAWLDRVRSYEDPSDMLADGFLATDPASLAAVAVASQSPRVPSFKTGRRVGAPTQSIRLTPAAVEEGWVHTLTVNGEEVTITIGSGDTLGDVCTDLAAAINGTAAAVTADGTSGTHVDVDADAAGAWFAFGGFDARLTVDDQTAEPATTLATDLAAIRAEDADWYGLIVADAQSSAQIGAASAWAQTETIVYAAHSMDSDVATSSTSDVASVIKAASALRSFVFYNRRSHGLFPDAALLGALFPLTVGSADSEYKQLVGVLPDALTSTELERLIGTKTAPTSGKRASVYVEATPTGTNSGTPISLGGLTAGGEWLDVVIGIDFTTALLQERAFTYRLNNPKPPFTEAGIDAFAGTVKGSLRTVSRDPYNILDEASITVEATALEDLSAAERAARYYDGVRFDARVQGAIRAVRFTGTVRP